MWVASPFPCGCGGPLFTCSTVASAVGVGLKSLQATIMESGSSGSSREYDVIVLGAGIEGSSTAYNLTKNGGGRVLLLEQVCFYLRQPQ